MEIVITLALCLHANIPTTTLATPLDAAAPKMSPTTIARNSPPTPRGETPFNQAMKSIVEAYITIQESLAHDHIRGVHKAARDILAHQKALHSISVQKNNQAPHNSLVDDLSKHTRPFLTINNLHEARAAFYELSYTITLWATTAKPSGFALAFCSMAHKGEGAGWLQKTGPLRNPYYGSAMLECGKFVDWP